jgi:hypothetical protein
MRPRARMRALTACAVAVVSTVSFEAAACGCFASTTTTVDPVIQAGERILFAVDGNQVTAHVQIQFKGDAADFGWLLPLPAVPQVKAGTDEVFEALDLATRPTFALTTSTNPQCRPRGGGGGFFFGCGAPAALSRTLEGGEAQDAGSAGGSALVLRDTAGPYEYAVLKADSRAEMLTWLSNNRFVVPVTSDAALMPYIRPGGYFLALKLRSGQTTGDLRPVVLTYTSDYPMIPLILTSVTAVPNMGVLAYVLGSARAIPRNYHHVELNLLKLDWNGASNYQQLVTDAVGEAPDKHAFVTEYAASPHGVPQLASGARFGAKSALEAQPDAAGFVEYLYVSGYARADTSELPGALLSILETQIPFPPAFASSGISRQQFFKQLRMYLDQAYRDAHPSLYAGWPGLSYDASLLATAVWDGVAQPVIDAQAMLDKHMYLTRLFTTLSPQDMTADPVFGFNASLPQVPAQRAAARVNGCEGVPTAFSAGGYVVNDESQLTAERKAAMPSAARVETLAEEGEPTVVRRYVLDLPMKTTGGGCQVADGAFAVGLGALWLLLRRRRIS